MGGKGGRRGRNGGTREKAKKTKIACSKYKPEVDELGRSPEEDGEYDGWNQFSIKLSHGVLQSLHQGMGEFLI